MAGRGRYAPSPTGALHLGNLRTALLAWLHARLTQSEFILRIDDIDLPRCQPGTIEQNIADLRWLGIDWDYGTSGNQVNRHYQQSQRLDIYQQAFEQLQQQRAVYPCCCSRKDIAQALSAPHSAPSSIYPGTCRDKNTLDGTLLAWRFRVADDMVLFEDKLLGAQQQNLATAVGDFVLKRKDGLFSYQFASVVDDITMQITDVVRGADLIDSSARQITLHRALYSKVPQYWHVPLLMDAGGRRMSKRGGAISAEQWRQKGKNAAELVAQFAFDLGFIDQCGALSCSELLSEITAAVFIRQLRP